MDRVFSSVVDKEEWPLKHVFLLSVDRTTALVIVGELVLLFRRNPALSFLDRLIFSWHIEFTFIIEWDEGPSHGSKEKKHDEADD